MKDDIAWPLLETSPVTCKGGDIVEIWRGILGLLSREV
jgi:hypothetical protein